MVHNEPGSDGWKRINERYNRFAADHGGRPLMNQTQQLDRTPGIVARTLPGWPAFTAALGEAASERFFANTYFAQL